MALETWELWYPDAGATGLAFARCRIDATERVIVHAAPDALRIEVRDEAGGRVASGDRLRREGPYHPMTHLRKTAGGGVAREDRWPDADDIGATVLLAGGEAGVLKAWWNAEDGSEWRWTVEFYNSR